MLVPWFSIFLPIVLFDLLLDENKRIAAAIVPLPLTFAFIHSLSFAVHVILFLLISIVFAYLFVLLTNSWHRNNTLRDSYTETHALLMQKNEELLDDNAQNMLSATLQERNRIARDIHDNVGHSLTRSILQVAAIKTLNKSDMLSEHIDSLQATLNSAMHEIRASVHNLNHASINLHQAVEDLLTEFFNNESNLTYTLNCDISSNAPSDVKYCFLMVVKEALTNIKKHSNAGKVRIVMQEHPAIFQLMITDNGANFSNSLNSGIGLDNIKARVSTLGGSCSLGYSNGFRIFISIPKIN